MKRLRYFLPLLLAVLAVPCIATAAWKKERVDEYYDTGHHTSLALDSSDNPHISYYDTTNKDLMYAYRVGTTWTIERVDETYEAGEWTSLALDSSDNPHISYYDSYNKDLKYAYRAGTTWHAGVVDTTGIVGTYTSLALDSNDNPHISYRDYDNGDLKYAQYTGLDWLRETVDTGEDVGHWISLALDSYGYPYISYYDNHSDDLKYAYYTGTRWQIETVDRDYDAGLFTSLALDSNGNPHISYYDATKGDLKYAYWVPAWSAAYDPLLDSESDLELLRQYRDEVLSKTASGKKYKDLLYKSSEEALEVLLDNPELMAQAKALIEANKDAVMDVLDGYEGVIHNTDEIVAFLDAYASEAPPVLKVLVWLVKWDMLREKRWGGLFFGFRLE